MLTPRRIVEDVLTAARTKRLWTSIYEPALPVTPQDFDNAALMPMCFGKISLSGDRDSAAKPQLSVPFWICCAPTRSQTRGC